MGTRKAAYKQAPFSIKAAADLRDKEGFGYELDSVGDAILATAADADGIILNGANDNEWISVAPSSSLETASRWRLPWRHGQSPRRPLWPMRSRRRSW